MQPFCCGWFAERDKLLPNRGAGHRRSLHSALRPEGRCIRRCSSTAWRRPDFSGHRQGTGECVFVHLKPRQWFPGRRVFPSVAAAKFYRRRQALEQQRGMQRPSGRNSPPSGRVISLMRATLDELEYREERCQPQKCIMWLTFGR